MHDLPLLRDLVLLVAIAIPVVALAQRLRVPSIVGFLLTGVLIGPHALGLIHELASVNALAEIGVVLLLFAIGLELSLARIIGLGRVLVQGGVLQVGATMLAVLAVALALAAPPRVALLYAMLAALSSTAVVLKVYTERDSLDSPDGRVVVAILLFQDLLVVPLVLGIRLLGGDVTGGGAIAREIGVALALVAALLGVGRWIVPRLLHRIVSLRNREIFTLCIMLLGLGAAWLTARFGLSLAIGAFLAGLVISESEYGIQALSDILPFRDTFSGIFFTSVGMLLNVEFVLAHPALVLGVAAGLFAVKALAGAFATLTLRRPTGTSVQAGLALAQVGEFSFVLATVAAPTGLLAPEAYQVFLGASVLTMLATPFVIAVAPAAGRAAARLAGALPTDATVPEAEEILSDHVIIVGYGVGGRHLARVLDAAGIPYVILEQNGQVVRQARVQLQPILFGDATGHEVLERAGIARARTIVFAISSPQDERRGVAMARHLAPDVRIVIRTRYVRSIEGLLAAGATEVIPEEFETSLEMFTRVLRHYNVPANTIEREIMAARAELYGMGDTAAGLQLDTLAHLGVHHAIELVEVEAGSPAIGGHPTTLHLRRETGATVIAVVRAGEAHYAPDPAFRFAAGDTVVLVGDDTALAAARAVFSAS